MAKLTAISLLGGYKKSFNGTVLEEVTNVTLLALALPRKGEAAARKAISAHFGASAPNPTKSTVSKDKRNRLVQMQPDQIFAMVEGRVKATKTLNSKAYVSDITDGWVQLRVKGALAHAALERLSKVDLRDASFPVDASARTDLEHMGGLIVKEGKDQYLLLSASSSAHSFLHAIEVSLKHVS